MKNIGLILVAAALVMAFRPDLSRFILTNENDANANITAPPRALQKIVAPIRDTKWDADDAKRLSEFYLALADVIERDENGIVKSSAEVRLINERSGRLCLKDRHCRSLPATCRGHRRRDRLRNWQQAHRRQVGIGRDYRNESQKSRRSGPGRRLGLRRGNSE